MRCCAFRAGGQAGKGGVRIDFPISRQDIAEMTGTTLHTVSRILMRLGAEGLVEGGPSEAPSYRPAGLAALAEGGRD